MRPPKTQPITCAQDCEHHRYDVWLEYDDEENSLEGSGDGDDY